MSGSNFDFLMDIYEICLTTNDCPYTILGKRIADNLGLFAVSIWSQHPQVQGALSRLVYFQSDLEVEIVSQDQTVAERTFDDGKSTNGRYGTLYYWAMPLAGKSVRSVLVLWSKTSYTEAEQIRLQKLRDRLAVLFDLIAIQDYSLKGRLTQELQTTRFIQEQLRPSLRSLGMRQHLSYRVLPAHELGGDYVDIIPYSDGRVGLTLADAMGKGVPGAFVMLIARTIFRFIASERIAPHKILRVLNNQFLQELGEVDAFVTQVYCLFDPKDKNLVYANAGHNPPVLFRRRKGQAKTLSGNGIALGGKANVIYDSYKVQLEVGDILILYSDGLLDARDNEGCPFGLQGILDAVVKYKEYSADGICDGLINTVMRSYPKQIDDLSLIVLKVE